MKKEWLFRLVLIAISSSFTLIAVEAGYRFFLNEQHQFSVSPTGNQYKFYQFDPQLGWANTPGASGTYTRGEFSYQVSINKYGMRQHPVKKRKAAGTYRIAVLGDSFVWGIGINDKRRLTELLDGMLPHTEVLNFGTSGYGPVQYLKMVNDLVEFQPNLVILVFCLGNDFSDNVLYQRYGYYKPYAVIPEGGKLLVKGYPLPNIKKFGFEKVVTFYGSKLLGELRNQYLLSNLEQKGLIGFSEELLYAEDGDLSYAQTKLKTEAIHINEAILSDISKKLEKNNIRFIVSSAPTKREYSKQRNGHDGYYLSVEQALQQSTNNLGIAFIPNVRKLNGFDFWVKDGHWNPSGHRKMALSIASYILDNGYLPASKILEQSP